MTVSLKPHLYNYVARKQLKFTIDKLYKLLKGFSNNFMMIGELTKKLNIHYHVILKFKDMDYSGDLLLEVLKASKDFGNTLINDQIIENIKRTYDYMIKDHNRTNTIVNNIKYGKSNYTQLYQCCRVYVVDDITSNIIEPDTNKLDDNITIDDFILDLISLKPKIKIV